jgi:hypothetical protein
MGCEHKSLNSFRNIRRRERVVTRNNAHYRSVRTLSTAGTQLSASSPATANDLSIRHTLEEATVEFIDKTETDRVSGSK